MLADIKSWEKRVMLLCVRQKEKSVDGWEVVEEGEERTMGSWDAV